MLVAAKLKHPKKLPEPVKLQFCYFVKFITFVVAVQHIFSLDFPMLMLDLLSFKNIAGYVLLECIAMSAFSSNFNLPKKFRTLDFRI